MASLAAQLRPLLIAEEDLAGLDVHGRIDAAVLVPLYLPAATANPAEPGEPGEALTDQVHAVFTRRRDDLRSHAGEISFPGGRQDLEEEDLRATALREAQEEIGLPADAVEIVGGLQPTPTVVTNYAIYPFVGVIEAGLEWQLSAAEVAEVLELPLHRLRDSYERRRLLRRGVPYRTDVYVVDDHLIWGATARIVADLLERLEPLLDRLPLRG